ncbi:MAG: diaminopropionate ammonia-lyase [Negativicutes bacterium]
MNKQIDWQINLFDTKGKKADLYAFSQKEIAKVRNFHRSIPGYKPTPLRDLDNLATKLGLGKIFIKDESYRFGLNAFKVLGGSFAIAKYLAQKLNKSIEQMPFSVMTSDAVRRQLGDVTFATTTDGNHGRGVAWTANVLKQKSVVHMPVGSSQFRLDMIRAEGATADITNMNYDDTVRLTAKESAENGWVIIQDTAWEGYEEIPLWIMQGYGTMALEADEQIAAEGFEPPTHVFVQAGVGSLAGAIQGYFADRYGADVKVVIAEARAADCLYRSAVANDGQPHNVGGDLTTIMAGLACGEPNIIGWKILRDYSSAFVSCRDVVAAYGMRLLGNPLTGDAKVVSGESGAVTAGLLSLLMTDNSLAELKTALGLCSSSRVLMFSTEGDTDPEHYREVVWNGKLPL